MKGRASKEQKESILDVTGSNDKFDLGNNLSCNVSVTHSKGFTPNPMKLCKFFAGVSGSGSSFRRIK